MAAGEFKETFIEKVTRENICEYRSIRLDEWRKDDKIYRNWTYVNCLPLDNPALIGVTQDPKTLVTTSSQFPPRHDDPPSPTIRNRKQERILAKERLEIERETRRIKEPDSPTARSRKQQRILEQACQIFD